MYIRKKIPAQRTIRKWYESIDGAPGCTKEALFAIKLKTKEAKLQNRIVNLVQDEMYINIYPLRYKMQQAW